MNLKDEILQIKSKVDELLERVNAPINPPEKNMEEEFNGILSTICSNYAGVWSDSTGEFMFALDLHEGMIKIRYVNFIDGLADWYGRPFIVEGVDANMVYIRFTDPPDPDGEADVVYLEEINVY